MRTGMTSVTFRKKSVNEIVQIVKEAGLDGIEWGGDIHVPAGNREAAENAKALCEEAGLGVLSYGSYFRGDEGEDFAPILQSAVALGAPVIRIWAGRKPYEQMSEEESDGLAARIREAADAARDANVEISFEYHRGTATQTKEGALALLKKVRMPNVSCYWQPNPDVTMEERLAEIDALLPFLTNIHVFNWTKGNLAHPLGEGKNDWVAYLNRIREGGRCHDLILEFVKDEKDEAFLEDAASLKAFAKELKL